MNPFLPTTPPLAPCAIAYTPPSQQILPCRHVDLVDALPGELYTGLDEDLAPSSDGFLEYIDAILMDETFEDSSWQLLAHNGDSLADSYSSGYDGVGKAASMNDRYERIFEGFNQILDQSHSSSAFAESVTEIRNNQPVAEGWEGYLTGLQDDEFSPIPYLQKPEEEGLTNVFGQALHSTTKPKGTSDAGRQPYSTDLLARFATQQFGGLETDRQASVQTPLASGRPETQDVSLVHNKYLPAELFAKLFEEFHICDDKEAALSSIRTVNGQEPHAGRRDEALEGPVDLKGLLLSSGKALGRGNVRQAMDYLQQIQQEGGASPHGSGLQRVVHYFSEALMERLSGMGNMRYKALASTAQLPSPLMMVKAVKMVFNVCPYVKIAYLFNNQYILKAASGVSRLHIVDYGILYGFQWPCLIYTLAHREGGPPFLRITGIEFPASPAAINPRATTEGTSNRLREYAKTYNVPFEYHAISSSKWETVGAASLQILPDELLVINSVNRLGHIHDETVMHPSPRDQLLKQMRSLNPSLLVMGSVNVAHSTPFFEPRFREAFYFYSNLFDMIHTTMMNDSPEREMFERELMGRSIMNIVVCEGVERVELPENYKQWEARTKRAGFRQLAVIPSVLNTAKAIVKKYHKDFDLLQDSKKWLLVGWRGRSIQALSAWEPKRL